MKWLMRKPHWHVTRCYKDCPVRFDRVNLTMVALVFGLFALGYLVGKFG